MRKSTSTDPKKPIPAQEAILHGKFENNGKLYALLSYKNYSSLTSSTEHVKSNREYYAGPGISWKSGDKRIYIRLQPPAKDAVFKDFNIPADTDPRNHRIYIGPLEYGFKWEKNSKHILMQGIDVSLYRTAFRMLSGEFITFRDMDILRA